MENSDIQDAVTRHAQKDMAKVPAASHDPPKTTAGEISAGGLKRFWRELAQTLNEKFHQGRDEVANALFHHDGYMPWPGMTAPTLRQKAENAVDLQEEITKAAQSRADEISYADMLTDAAGRGGDDPDRGMSR